MKWLKIMLNCHYRNVNINIMRTFLEAKPAIVTVRTTSSQLQLNLVFFSWKEADQLPSKDGLKIELKIYKISNFPATCKFVT